MPPFSFTKDDFGNFDLVRRIVLYRLAHDPEWRQLDTVWANQGVVEFPGPQGHAARQQFLFMASDVMHRLFVEDIVAPGTDPNNLKLPWFHLTTYGREVLNANSAVPHDPSGYLANLRQITLRPVLLEYAEEAVRCFDSGCFTAAVFFLGVACEALVVEIHSVLKTVKASTRAPVKQKHDELMRLLRNAPNADKAVLPETLDIQLGAAYDMIRRQRNQLGHPQISPPTVDQKQAFTFFMVFPDLVRDIEAFGQYCAQKGL